MSESLTLEEPKTNHHGEHDGDSESAKISEPKIFQNNFFGFGFAVETQKRLTARARKGFGF